MVAEGMDNPERPQYYVDIDKTETHRGIYPRSGATEHGQGQPVLKRKTAEAKYEHFLIGLDECNALRKAICDGHGFNIDIAISYYHSFQFGRRDWDEGEFVSILTNVLHLLISSHKIGLDYASIVGAGIECMECRREENKFGVTVSLPTAEAGVPGSIQCACACVISRNMARVDVTCILHGTLPTLPNEYQFQPTGNVATRAFLGQVGYLSLLAMIQNVSQIDTKTDETAFRVDMQAWERSLDYPTIGRAFEEAVVQGLAVNNVPHAAVHHIIASQNPVELKVVVTVPPPVGEESLKRDPLIFTFHRVWMSTNTIKQGSKKCPPRHPDDRLFPPFCDYKISFSCGEWRRQPEVQPIKITKFGGGAKKDEYAGRVQYLMKCLKDRGLGCTESTVREIISVIQHGGRVQLFLRDVWNRQIAFLTQNKTAILDMVEDTLRTLMLLFTGEFSPTQLILSMPEKCPEWPNTRSGSKLRMYALDGKLKCKVDRDLAGNNILSIVRGSQTDSFHLFAASEKKIGGIILDGKVLDLSYCHMAHLGRSHADNDSVADGDPEAEQTGEGDNDEGLDDEGQDNCVSEGKDNGEGVEVLKDNGEGVEVYEWVDGPSKSVMVIQHIFKKAASDIS
jgi:hypothetical protein